MNLNKAIFKFVRISFSVLVILLVVFGLTKLGMFGYDFGYRVFTEGAMESAPRKDVTVQVTSDMSEYEIAQMLEEKGLTRDAKLFVVQLKLSSYSHKLQPGVYVLNTSMEPEEMMALMATDKEKETETQEMETVEADTQALDTQSTQEIGTQSQIEE